MTVVKILFFYFLFSFSSSSSDAANAVGWMDSVDFPFNSSFATVF